MKWRTVGLLLGASICSVATARATDIWGVRLGAANAMATGQAAATMGSLGVNEEVFVDGWGLRFGADLGIQYYTLGGRSASFTLAPELAYYKGRDAATFRTYWVGQAILAARAEVLEGLRLGPELEWRDICNSDVRVAWGLFYQPLRERGKMDWLAGGVRLTIAWGRPTSGCVESVDVRDLPGAL